MAADRQIGFVQQQQPGHLDMISLIQSKKKTVAVVHRFSAKPSERTHPIQKEQFDSIWAVFTSTAVDQYEFVPNESDSMSDPKFYTIKIEGASQSKSLRIPIADQLAKPISDAVRQIQAWIEEKG